MDLTPQLLHDVEFREAKRGGYNTHDVDEFLERLAVALERQSAAVQDARQRVEAAEQRAAEAERQAAMTEQSVSEGSASQETLQRTLVLAQRTADAAIREAEEEADRVRSEAQAEADRLLGDAHEVAARTQAEADAEAVTAHEATRTRLVGEMRDLERARERLREDVQILERHLDEQRDRVRAAVGELQRMLDDPESLYEVELPVVSDVVAPAGREALAGQGPVDVDVDDGYEEVDGDAEGPPTEAVEMPDDRDPDDDAYLTELRKAMTDETPLGPRDNVADSGLFEPDTDVGRSRFGRRRSS